MNLFHFPWSRNVPAPEQVWSGLGRKYDTSSISFFRSVPLNGIPVESTEIYIDFLKYYACSTELIPFWWIQQNTRAVQLYEEIIFEVYWMDLRKKLEV